MSIASLSCVVGATMATAQNNSAADAERGDQFFQTSCALCHSDSLGSGNTVVIKQGPTLIGVMGRKAGTSPHFGFTQALKDSGLLWNAETPRPIFVQSHDGGSRHKHDNAGSRRERPR